MKLSIAPPKNIDAVLAEIDRGEWSGRDAIYLARLILEQAFASEPQSVRATIARLVTDGFDEPTMRSAEKMAGVPSDDERTKASR